MDTAATLASSDGALAATFLPSLGMVCSSLEYRGEELLAQRGGPEAYAARGLTFGIPLLYPWANRLSAWGYEAAGERVELEHGSKLVHVDGASGLPMHGVLAASPFWRVTDSAPDALSAELDFGAQPELLATFPFPHRLALRAAVQGTRLAVRLTVTPTAATPVPIAFGFHPYLTLPGSARLAWSIELPVRRRTLLDARGLPTGESESIAAGALDGPLAGRAFDDCFDELGPGPFALVDERRRVTVEFTQGYPVAQVYTPADSDFICFEPMTAPVDALRSGRGLRFAEPGAPFTAEFVIAVSSRSA